uniref:Uncharacterized protein n=1 Tax=Cannabis sativa TaxID=3483 RepID=A0A803PR56_CANSA
MESQRTNTSKTPRSGRNDEVRQLRLGNQEIPRNDERNLRNQPRSSARSLRHPQRPSHIDKENMQTYLGRGHVSNLFRRRRPMRDEMREASSSTGESRSYRHSRSTGTPRQT